VGIPRQYETQQVHYVRRDFSFATAGLSTGVLVGTLPAGSRILSSRVYIDTAFNGTTPTLQGGTTATGSNLFTSTDAAPATTGAKTPATAAGQGSGLVLAQDQDFFLSGNIGGSTAGAGSVTIEFIPLSNGG
jgi:hypothetical protein